MKQSDELALLHGDLDSRKDRLQGLLGRAHDGDPSAREALRALVTNYSDYHRSLYTVALNHAKDFGDASLEAPLLAALVDRQYNCQAWAAMGATALGFRTALPHLAELLDHQQWIAREQAVIGFGELAAAGDESIVRVLAPLLGDPAEWMRQRTAEALAKIGGDLAFDALWEELADRRFARIGYVASALATFTPGVVRFLIEVTDDGDPDQRYWAAIGLGSTGDERAIPVLERLMAEDDGRTVFDGWVNVAAKKALRTLRRIQAAVAARESVGNKVGNKAVG